MPVTKEHGYQIHLPEPEQGQENLQELVCFAAKTVIYINGHQTAVLQKDCYAKPTRKKRKGLGEYIAQSRLDLYFNTHFWSMPPGTMFTAYANKGKKLSKNFLE